MMEHEEQVLAEEFEGREGGMCDGEIEMGEGADQPDELGTQLVVGVRSRGGCAVHGCDGDQVVHGVSFYHCGRCVDSRVCVICEYIYASYGMTLAV